MKKFTGYSVVLFIVFIATVLIVLSQADGSADAYYLRFTTARQSSLILGTSKAAQGIQPAVLKRSLKTEMYNYSFSLSISPYGPVYLRSIKNKLDTTRKNGIFILTVDPWSISSNTADPNDSTGFRENNSCIALIENVNKKPNYKYLLHYYEGSYYQILSRNSPARLTGDGWLEVSLNEDEQSIQRRITYMVSDYREKIPQYNYSSVRLRYLLATIRFLENYGQVYLVRLPVHPELFEVEMKLMPDFDAKINEAIGESNGYLDLSDLNSSFTYTDGVHLNRKSGEEVTQRIADWIQNEGSKK